MEKTKRKGKKYIVLKILIPLLIIIVAVRLWLPSFILKKVNRQLSTIDGYEGSVRDIDLFLIAGEYSIADIELNKKEGKIPVPFFSAENIFLSVEWSALFQGEIVGEIVVKRPVLNYVKGPTEEESQTEVDNDWISVVDNLMPLKINRFEIINGAIHFRDFHAEPQIDLLLENVDLLATNLTNAKDHQKDLPSTVTAGAKAYEGLVSLNMRLDPLNESPTFDLNAELTTLKLSNLNNFLREYGNFDVKGGSISLYAEAASRDNKITGYVKPIVKDLDVTQWKEKGSVLQKVWEGVVGAIGWVFENKSKDQVATQIEFQGTIDNPDVNLWTLIGQVLQNAFIEALYPSLENSISIGSLSNKDGSSRDASKEDDNAIEQLFDSNENEN